MDFDPRWSDDPRERDDYGRDRGDLRHLRDSGLVETIPTIGNDRALVVLTERGRDVLERNRWSSVHREELKWAAVSRERQPARR
jgi:DNA-binding PadR family transcriptional regulator